MAQLPYFILSPSTVLSTIGLVRGPDPTIPTPAEDWRTAIVDVVIPALNEEQHITLCLASVLRQTVQPRRIIMVDDGSTDRTVALAEAFCAYHGMNLTVIRRRKPIGKTPTIKRQARELDSDVEFILDADTLLESDNYIERAVQELYQAVGIASACGTILPLKNSARRKHSSAREQERFYAQMPGARPVASHGRLHDFEVEITNLYREVLYLFLQRFVYRGQMVFFGTTTNPVGCAVAYRRKYVERLFDHFGPIFGDDLTNSEDIFIGFAMLNEGYRNIQLTDVYARTSEPPLHRLPRQMYLWSSAFLQSCYYFDPLMKSPLKAIRRAVRRKPSGAPAPAPAAIAMEPALAAAGLPNAGLSVPYARVTQATGGGVVGAMEVADLEPHAVSEPARRPPTGAERRVIQEPYRQAFGRERTLRDGRPAGWMLMMAAVEKVFFPTALLIMAIVGNWFGLALTLAVETLISVAILAAVMTGRRLEYIGKGLAVAPLRYGVMISEFVTLGRFAGDMWITRNRNWRK